MRPHQRAIVNHSRVPPHVPTPAEPERDDVPPRNQVLGDFVGDVEIALGVVAHGGAQDVVIHFSAVDVQLVVAERIDVRHGPRRLARDDKRLPQPGGRKRRALSRSLRTPLANPFRTPIRRLQQAHRPRGRRAPGRRPARVAPDAHLPVDSLPRTERLAAILNPCSLLRRHAARIPQIAPVLLQGGRGARNQHAIGALTANTGRWRQKPAQPRLQDVDALRVRQVLAAEPLNGELRACRSASGQSRGSGWQSDQDDGQQCREVALIHEAIPPAGPVTSLLPPAPARRASSSRAVCRHRAAPARRKVIRREPSPGPVSSAAMRRSARSCHACLTGCGSSLLTCSSGRSLRR